MPAVIALFMRMLGIALPALGWKLLRGLGFAAVSYVGLKVGIDAAKDYAFSNLGAVPAQWVNVLGLLKVDVCINIIFSALIARLTLSGLDKSGSQKSFKWLGPK